MRLRRLSAVLAIALSASACDVTLPGTEPRISPDAVAAAGQGGNLRVGVVQPAGIDPLDAYEPGAQMMSSLVCETLVNVDPVTGEITAGLAKKVQVAGDGTTVTIELPRDLLTHDGDRLQANDLLATYSRLASPANASRARSILEPVQGYEDVAADLLADGEETLSGVIALNDLSIQINLVRKDPGFLARLAHPAMAPVSLQALELDPRGFRDMPICAGPYKMTEPFNPGARSMTIERFDGYMGQNPNFTAGGVGYADTIEFRFYGSESEARRAYGLKQIDVLSVSGPAVAGVPASDLVVGNAPDIEFLGFPIGLDGPFTDVEVRQTLSSAIDREQLVKDVWDGTKAPATGFFPPSLAAVHRDDACEAVPAAGGGSAELPASIVDLYDDVNFLSYDQAMADLREAADDGFASVPEWDFAVSQVEEQLGDISKMLPINVNLDGRNPLLALEIARQWRKEFGIASFPVVQNWQDYQRAATDGQGFAGAFRISWNTFGGVDPFVTVTDPQTFLRPMFGATSTNQGNWARWTNRDFDLNLDRYTVQESDDVTRGQMYEGLEDLLCGEMPLIPLATGKSHWLVGPRWAPAIEPAIGGHDGQLLLRELYQN